MRFLKNGLWHPDLIFLIIFLIMSVSYYDSVLDKGPLNNHLWRQADCLSITQKYFEGSDFIEPEMHLQFGDNYSTGKSAGEFPILYYLVGKIWNLTGPSYLVYRIFYFFILFCGLFALYKSLKILLNDNFWSIAITFLLFTSPVLVVFGVSFLTDAPAFLFILIALYFLLKYSKTNYNKYVYFSMLFFALAGLIKVSSLIAFVFILFIFFIEVFLRFKALGKNRLFSGKIHEWLSIALVFVCLFAWYYYADYYNNIHGFKYTFNNIHPIWIIKEEEIESLINGIKNYTSVVFFSRPILYLFLFVGVFNLIVRKKMPLIAYLSNIVITIGCIIYFILWAPLLGVHDYYFIAFLIIFIGVLMPFIWFIKENHTEIFKGNRVKIVVSVFLLFNFFYCLSVVKLKTLAQDGNFIMVGNHSFVKELRWVNWDVQSNWYRFERMRSYIRTIGIEKDDKIISLPDFSFNISLFLIDQDGWTNFLNYNKREDIDNLIDKGAEYLFISNPEFLSKEFLQPFLTNKVGSFEGVDIFKLTPNNNVIQNN